MKPVALLFFLWPVVIFSQPAKQLTRKKVGSADVMIASAQVPQAQQYIFTHFNSFNGLSSNIVTHITQDRKGYIWLCTYDGLQRYDGNRFLTFKNQPGNPASVPGDIVIKVMEDKKGNLWVWANNKVGIFDADKFTFSEIQIEDYNVEEGLPIHFLEQDPQGNATIFVYSKGIYTYDSQRKLFLFSYHLPADPKYRFIGYHHDPASTKYWFGSMRGLTMYDTKTGNLNYNGHNPDSNNIISLTKDDKVVINVIGFIGDEFWYITWDLSEPGNPFYVSCNVKTGEIRKFSMILLFKMDYHEPSGALIQKNGKMWFYGQSFMAEYRGGDQVPQLIRNEYRDEQSIRFNRAYYMFEDRQNNIWVCTDNGVFLFNPDLQLFNSYKLLRPDGTGAIDGPTVSTIQLDDGHIFVGSWGSGLYYYDKNFIPAPLPAALKKYEGVYSFWCMIEHSITGRIWMGMQGGSVLVYDPVTQKAEQFSPELVAGSTIRQVTEDHQGNLWFGMQGGHIVKWDTRAAGNDIHTGYSLVKKRDTGFIYKMITDTKGYIWVAKVARGLFKYNPATNAEEQHFTTKSAPGHRLWMNDPYDILQYNDSTLLVAGNAINVVNTNTNKIHYITSADGLSSNTALCVTKDDEGTLWIGMNHGLSRAVPDKKLFYRYDRRDGIAYDNFTQAGAYRLKDGRLVFTSDDNFIAFDPRRIMKAPPPPDVVITNFQLADKSLPVDSLTSLQKITLPYDNTSIAFEFSTLNFVRQNKIHYQYIMEGLHKDWQEAEENSKAVFNYLAPGEYTFRLRAENTDGVSSRNTIIIKLQVNPPFWEAWWFYAILILLIVVILYMMDRERVSRITALQQVRTQIAGNLHDEINTTLNNINMLSEMAKIKADKDITRSKEYIDQISEKSHNMIIAMDDMLWSIDPVNDNMEKTVLRIKEFVEALMARHGINIQMQVDQRIQSLKLDMKSRHEFFLIFKETLWDMVQKTYGEDMLINIDLVKSKLSLKIRDTGNGTGSAIVLNGNTLKEVKRRAASINAELDIQSDSKGTSFILLVPV